jgi:thiamine-monophosphate kinase
VVTGDLGGAFMGLQVLEREKQVFLVNPQSQPDLTAYAYIIERQLKPEARIDVKDLLEKLDVKPTAMIDISDGLSSEIIHICKASKVGCQIFEEKIPMDPELIATCEEFNLSSATVTLNGGEDYELLFTIALDDFEKIKANPNFTVIGHIQEEAKGVNLISRLNQTIPIKARGFNHLQ